MNYSSQQKAGIALIVFSLLLICTIILHPSGGSPQHIINMSTLMIVTHTIAIFSFPIGSIGFWGLSRKIGTGHFGSAMGLAMMMLGLVAGILAAAINGLAIPIYLQHYNNPGSPPIDNITPILQFGFAINHAFDYIYTGAACIAILTWSIAILMTKKLPGWIGWFGIASALLTAAVFLSGTAVNNVHGLRIFVSSTVAWIIATGAALFNEKLNNQ